jgi:DNA-binding transcriptional LysR family regulator
MITRLQPSDVKLLRLFVQVAESAGFSAAARAINISQSTISIQFKLLEQRLGFPLCRRGRAGFELTPEGRKILEAAKTLEQGMSDFIAKSAEVTREVYGALSIGVSQIVSRDQALAGLPALISRLNARSPKLRVRLEVCRPSELEHGIDRGEFDIAYMETGFLRRDLETVQLFDMRSNIYCAAGHPLAALADEAIDDAALGKHRSVVFDLNAPFLNPLRRDDSEITASSESSIFFIMSGGYIGYLSDVLAEPWLARGQLRRIAPQRYACNFPGGLVFRKSSLANPIILHAIDAARELADAGGA